MKITPKPPCIYRVRGGDIAPIFNLVQHGASEGAFNNIYRRPTYQAGLALQIFSVWLLRKIRLPSGKWYAAKLEVAEVNGEFAGFILTRLLTSDGQNQEIYMCGVRPQFRNQGLGKRLIRRVLARLPIGGRLEAQCLPNSVAMKRLLGSLGFRTIGPTTGSSGQKLEISKIGHCEAF